MERIFDNHFHLNFHNDYMSSVMIFKKAGGTSINLTNLPFHGDATADHYTNLYEKHLRMAGDVKERSGIDVIITIGPYPLDIFTLWKDIHEGEEMARKGIDLAVKLCMEGKANAVGEIGRPHFPVDHKIMEACNRVMGYAFQKCSDSSIPVILHTEDLDKNGAGEIESMAVKSGMKPEMVVKHHAMPQSLLFDSNLVFSVPANRKAIRDSMDTGKYFMMETDHINDPANPGKYLPADAVPKRAEWIRQEYGEKGERLLQKAFFDIPERLFGENSFRV